MAPDPGLRPVDEVPAFDELLARYGPRVYAFCCRLAGAEAAEDLAQEVWLAVYRALPKFRGQSKPTTWLFGIAVRVHGKQRRRRRVETVTEQAAAELADGDPAPDQRLLADELAAKVREAIDRLPPGQREVVHLRQLEGLAYAEIAEVLKIPVGTVRSRLHHGMSTLADRLAPYLEIQHVAAQ